MQATATATAARAERPDTDADAAAAPAAGVLPPRSPNLDAAAARRLYSPPQTDALPLLSAALALGCWATAMRHGLFSVRLPDSLGGAGVGGLLGAKGSGVGTSPWWNVALTFCAVEFCSTALFITAHDAMHGTVCRRSRALNDAVGRLCLALYAWFDYGLLHEKHWEHHNHTGLVGGDPDFHGGNPSFLSWFVRFMTTYSRPGQYARIVAWVFFLQALGAPYGNVVLFVAAAPIAAAFRLFYFGTYLPHLPPALAEGKEAGWRAGGKEGSAKEGQEEEAAAAAPLVGAARPSLWRRLAGPARDGSARMAWQLSHSADVPPLVAFLSCLCFGYHWEHHRFPYAPWFDLPKVRGLAREHGLRRRCVDAYLREAAGGEVAEQQRRALRGAGGEGVKAA